MDCHPPRPRAARTIRIDDERLAKLLDHLDIAAGSQPDALKKTYKYRIPALMVQMQQPGLGTPLTFSVASRSLSDEDITFLHGGFVHVDTRCRLQLPTTYGTEQEATGVVRACRYLDGNIHEVTVRFDAPVNPAVYCAAAVQHRVLLAEDDPVMARLAIFHLQHLNAGVDHVSNGREAFEKAERISYDIILLDMEMPVMDGFAAAAALREKGYGGLIVALTGLTQKGDSEKCIAAGCDRYLRKPYSREDLADVLKSLRQEPLFSTFQDDPAMKPLVESFLADLPARIQSLEAAMETHSSEQLRLTARSLKSEGAGYGFEIITKAAESIESALIEGAAAESLAGKVKDLVRLCHQARAGRGSGDSKPFRAKST